MAKPLNTSDTSYSPVIFSDPISLPGRTIKKRAHNYGDDGNEDDSQKTRRVNPQRLAARLGPEIVAEMEALIYPGAKMPSFEVRRVIQERYSVDRRHIYDYFHSRGLRVAKEDRHLNLTRGRLSKILAQQTVEKQLPPVTPSDPKCSIKKPHLGENQDLSNPEGDSSKAETQITPAQAIKSPVSRHLQIYENTKYLSARNAKLVATERITGNKYEHCRAVATEGVSHLVNDRPLSKKRKMGLARSKPLINTPFARTPSPCLVVPVENAWDNLDDDFSLSGCSGSPEFFFALCDVSASPNTEFFMNTYQPKTPVTIEGHHALTQTERHELYNFINDSIGMSSGIMEQAGTYTAYMKQRTQNYFDRIGSSAHFATKIIHEAHEGLFSNSNVSTDEDIDFRNWLSDYTHDGDENFCADSLHYEVFKPFEDQAMPTVLLHHGPTVQVQGSGYTIVPSHLINLELSFKENPTCITRFEQLRSNSGADLSVLTSQSASPNKSADRTQTLHSTLPRQRRHTTRLRITPFVHKKTSNLEVSQHPSNMTINSTSEVSHPYPDYNNRLLLHIPRPRLRTSSAGGGL